MLDQGERRDCFADDRIKLFSFPFVISLFAFIFWDLCARTPIVNLRVLRYRGVWAGSLLGAALGLALFGSLAILRQYTESQLRFTALLSGQLLSVRALAMALFLPLGARLATSGRIDPRWQIGIGMLILGISRFVVAPVTTANTPFEAMVPPLVVSGIGLSQVFVPLQFSICAGLSQADVPNAASFFNLARQLGGSIAAATLVTLLSHEAQQHQAALRGAITLASPAVRDLVHGHPACDYRN